MAERKKSKRKKRHVNIPNRAVRPVVASGPLTLRGFFLSKHISFAIGFAFFCIALYAIIEALPSSFTRPINENTAWILGLVLNALGIPVAVAGDTVAEEGLAFRIVPECTPIFTAGLFLSFVVFHPAKLPKKAIGLLTGVTALYLGNLVRLAATFMISRSDRGLFEVVHVYLGQVFTIFLVIIVCIAYLRWLERDKSKQSILLETAGFLVRFALISGCLFLIWTQIQHLYITLIDLLMAFGFSLFDYRIALARKTAFYYETFSLVCFTSLVLAARSLPRLAKIKGLAAGLGLLFFIHLFHRIDNAMIAYFNFTAILPVDMTLLVVGQYLLPVLFLIFLVNYRNNMSLTHNQRRE